MSSPSKESKHELLWRRLEDAKLQLDLCHNFMKEIREDQAAGAISLADGNYAHGRALRAEETAVERYARSLADLKRALASERFQKDTPKDSQRNLTPREMEVLALIASGKSSKQIAVQLGIAFRTVVCHRFRLQKELQAHTAADLTRAAIRMGLVEP